MEDLQREIERLKEQQKLLETKVAKNEGDCEQLWSIIRLYFVGRIPRIGKIKLDRKTVTTLFISLSLGILNIFLRFVDIF